MDTRCAYWCYRYVRHVQFNLVQQLHVAKHRVKKEYTHCVGFEPRETFLRDTASQRVLSCRTISRDTIWQR